MMRDPLVRVGSEERPTRARRWQVARVADGVWYAVLTVVCVALIFAGTVAAASVSPTFCGLCHAESVDSLADSEHAALRCDDCHADAGTLGLVESRLAIVAMVAASPKALLGSRDGGAVDPTMNAPCMGCHEQLVPVTIERNGIRMNHRAPQERGWLCGDCHRGSAHPDDRFAGASYSMDMCLECHATGTVNLTGCATCHVEGSDATSTQPTAWRATHGANWQQTHGMGNLNTCKTCHSPTYCNACHGISMPHPQNFLATHGDFVTAATPPEEDCRVCHQGSACENCHGIEMPHPAGYVKVHKGDAQKQPQLCERCHDRSSCESCHERHTHPGIPGDQLKLLLENPVTP